MAAELHYHKLWLLGACSYIYFLEKLFINVSSLLRACDYTNIVKNVPLASYLVVTYKALSMPEMEILCCKENADYEDC